MKIKLKTFLKCLLFGSLLMCSLSFRTSSTLIYPITQQSSTVWILFCNRPTTITNDLPQGDPLYGQTLTFTSLTQAVINDYNSVTTSYFRLADSATDPSYSVAAATNRTLHVCGGDTGLGGDLIRVTYASQSGGTVVSDCSVTIPPGVYSSQNVSSAKTFTYVMTHGIGHCIGLSHPMETIHAVMSYFPQTNRLEIDDQMGITFLYPVNPKAAQESATWGLSCSKSK